jgi:uncharacterized metal-binding protein YceD (DUF177 family)
MMRPAMASPLTVRATPAELADRQQVIETEEKIESFPRLAAIIETELTAVPSAVVKWRQFPVQITLRFGWAGGRREFVSLTGTVAARIAAVCQRCLQPFEYPVREGLDLVLARPNTVSVTAPGYEIWELDDEWLRPADLVEETLIMALPLVARHEDDKSCQLKAGPAAAEREDVTRPFADLRSQMQD